MTAAVSVERVKVALQPCKAVCRRTICVADTLQQGPAATTKQREEDSFKHLQE